MTGMPNTAHSFWRLVYPMPISCVYNTICLLASNATFCLSFCLFTLADENVFREYSHVVHEIDNSWAKPIDALVVMTRDPSSQEGHETSASKSLNWPHSTKTQECCPAALWSWAFCPSPPFLNLLSLEADAEKWGVRFSSPSTAVSISPMKLSTLSVFLFICSRIEALCAFLLRVDLPLYLFLLPNFTEGIVISAKLYSNRNKRRSPADNTEVHLRMRKRCSYVFGQPEDKSDQWESP